MLGRRKSRVVEIAPGQATPSTQSTSEEQTAKPKTSAPAGHKSAFHSIFFCFNGESTSPESEEHAVLMPKK